MQIAAIVPHHAMADSLMDEIASFIEENCEAKRGKSDSVSLHDADSRFHPCGWRSMSGLCSDYKSK